MLARLDVMIVWVVCTMVFMNFPFAPLVSIIGGTFIGYLLASFLYYLLIDRVKARTRGGTKVYDDSLRNCPKCGSKMDRGFNVKTTGLGWIPAKMINRFTFVGEPLVEADLRKIFISRAEYMLSYHCLNCKLFVVDYGTSCSTREAKQLGESVTGQALTDPRIG